MDKLTTTHNGLTIPLKSLGEQRFKSPALKSIDDNMRFKFLLKLITETYFKCGQKTSPEELSLLTTAFNEEIKDYLYITLTELEKVFKNGYKEAYGAYFGLNLKTFVVWIEFYIKNERNNDLSKLKIEPVKTKNEKKNKLWTEASVINCLDYFIDNEIVEDGKFYVYDILEKQIKASDEKKKQVYQDAKMMLLTKETAKPNKSRFDTKRSKESIDKLKSNKSGNAIAKAKEILLESFFRELIKDKDKLTKFRESFK